MSVPSSNMKRDISIDWIKFFSVFLIINSHADIMYPRFSMLATGGAIGDCLFLFISGFTLWLKRDSQPDFFTWYKRRINRIFPSVIAWLMIAGWIGYRTFFCSSMLVSGGEFVNAIMIYYILLYFIGKYQYHNLKFIYILGGCIIMIVYWLWFPYKTEVSINGLYGISTKFRWLPYFFFMLMGAHVGTIRKSIKIRPLLDSLFFIICLVIFYGFQYVSKTNPMIATMQIFTIIPLLGIVYYFYKICNAPVFTKLYNKHWIKATILTVGGLCLESYLIQGAFFTDKLNSIFPLNLVIISLAILIGCYFTRVLGNFFAQTFKDGKYDFKNIIKLY